ncbi:MAG: metal ABC transporter permease, partial [Thermoguttaceae bacterium]
MSDFFQALFDPDFPFLRYALLVGVLSSVSLGIVGSYVVTRRITYIAAAIAHSVLGGIGAALYLQQVQGLLWCDPMYGALCAAIAAAMITGLVSLCAKQREDTV